MTKKVIIILQTGQAIPSVFKKYGDFDDYFIQAMDIDKSRTKTYRVFEQLKFPDPQTIAGIIVTGSGAMVTQELDWSEKTIDWLKPFLVKDIPILGVCYGHQMLAKLLGGTVNWNPNGREIGEINLDFNQDLKPDPLFKGITPTKKNSLTFFATHQQSVTTLPDNVKLLGSTKLDPNHCFRYKKHIWGLQFHPEFSAQIIVEYIHARADDIKSEGLSPSKILKEIGSINHGRKLLENFKDICFST
jgi:GMP synthase (glutamine-hydrolysing)